MRRWIVISVALALLAFVAIVLPPTIPYLYRTGEENGPQDKGGYQAALASYAAVLKPGMTRQDVGSYLDAKKIGYTQMGGVDALGTPAVLVKIGEERPPLYCSENYIYVAFHFNPASGILNSRSRAVGVDTLKELTLFHYYGGCL